MYTPILMITGWRRIFVYAFVVAAIPFGLATMIHTGWTNALWKARGLDKKHDEWLLKMYFSKERTPLPPELR